MNEASIDEIKRDILFKDGSELPVLCISLFASQMIFTTKKVGSRYFEDITKPNSGTDNPTTIEFKILRYTDNQKSDPNFDSRLIFDNSILNFSSDAYFYLFQTLAHFQFLVMKK